MDDIEGKDMRGCENKAPEDKETVAVVYKGVASEKKSRINDLKGRSDRHVQGNCGWGWPSGYTYL